MDVNQPLQPNAAHAPPGSRRMATFLHIEPGEERLIGLPILLYFTLMCGVVFTQSMAFGVFISEYGVQSLPYSYISIALLASLVTLIYIKIGERVSFSRLLFINIIVLAGVSLVIWLALNSPLYHATAFILPLWFQIAINLANIAVWPLGGRLFDFRQGKRLFPLLSAGNWLANIVSGLFVPTVVRSIGANQLLLLSALSFGISLFVLRAISRAYLQQPAKSTQAAQRAQRPTETPSGIFKDRYILLILAYTMLWWVGFFFVDNIFYDRAFAQFPDANQLTAFMGQLLSTIGIVALISSTVITSRVIARFGLRVGLLAMPLLVLLTIAILAIGGSLGASLFVVFALGAFAKLINVAFGFSLSQSASAIVYQSLPDTIRGRVQTIAEGIAQPIAIGIAGLSLLALTAGLKLDYIGLAYVFIGLAAIWLLIIFLLSGSYIQALTKAITKRRLGDSAMVLADPASIALLRSRLHDAHPAVAIYALTKLEALDQQALIGALPRLIQHPAPEVRREAFIRIEDLKLTSALQAVHDQLAIEPSAAAKEAALRALGAIAGDRSSPYLIAALNETDIHSQRGALIGLLNYRDHALAKQKLESLLESARREDRLLAIQVVGNVKDRTFYPQLISACDSPETSRAAGLALASIGTGILPELETAFRQSKAQRQRIITLAKVLGHIGGPDAQHIIASRMSAPDSELRSHIFDALSQSGYHPTDDSAIYQAVTAEIEQAAWVCAAQTDLGKTDDTALIQAALQQFLLEIRQRVLLLLSFAFDSDSIQHVREALLAGSPTQVAYALEIMDTRLPAKWRQLVMPLLEELSPHERSQRWAALFPQVKQDPRERLRVINEDQQYTAWVRACAAYTSGRLTHTTPRGDTAMLSIVEKVLILKTVPMFSLTPDAVLADVAELLDEVDVADHETIFNQGDLGDSMYIIVEGKVRVHEGERLLNYLNERDVFGEMALLDPEPRIASVTAAEPTRLFRLDQAPFYQLMAERPEVAMGIIRVLTSHLRNRVRDIVELNARITALEGTVQVA